MFYCDKWLDNISFLSRVFFIMCDQDFQDYRIFRIVAIKIYFAQRFVKSIFSELVYKQEKRESSGLFWREWGKCIHLFVTGVAALYFLLLRQKKVTKKRRLFSKGSAGKRGSTLLSQSFYHQHGANILSILTNIRLNQSFVTILYY